jgi:hypothetical protein
MVLSLSCQACHVSTWPFISNMAVATRGLFNSDYRILFQTDEVSVLRLHVPSADGSLHNHGNVMIGIAPQSSFFSRLKRTTPTTSSN